MPKARWVEIEAAPLGADYAMKSADGEITSQFCSYTGPQPENIIWTVTIGLAKSVLAVSTAAPSSSPSSPTVPPAASSLPTASPPVRVSPEEEWPGEILEFETGLAFYTGDGHKKISRRRSNGFAKRLNRMTPGHNSISVCATTKAEVCGKTMRKRRSGTAKRLNRMAPTLGPNLGVCYSNGEGVPKNYVEAVKWYRKAAEQNLDAAQYDLGVCYDNGQGLQRIMRKR